MENEAPEKIYGRSKDCDIVHSYYPVHDYYRDSRQVDGTRYYAPVKPAVSRSAKVLMALVVAVLVIAAQRFMSGQ